MARVVSRHFKRPFTDSDVFYDLGSGRGLVSATMFVALGVRRSVGIELATHRIEIACNLSKLLLERPQQQLTSLRSAVYQSDAYTDTLFVVVSVPVSWWQLKETFCSIRWMTRRSCT